ncbi:MAG: flagellar filament capping protein FliD [Nitrospirae bacterium]|nr:flagellar filament capping protein FliD [Nitrospirota bacterium]
MGISSSGLISGINVDQLLSQLIQLERRPITLLQQRQKDYELKIASILDMSTKLSSFKSALDALNSSSKFNTKTASVTKTSSGAELLTVSASSTASAGSYSIQVNQLATANKKASQGWVDENTTAIASSAGTFKFKVGSGGAETSISVSTTTTLQGLRDAINSANGGVTATIINDGTGSNPYRLILTANNTGSSNTIYITQNNTNLDFANKKIEDAYAYTTNSYTGSVYSNSGNYYTGTDNKTYLVKITTAGAPGTAKYKYSTDGGITWSSEITTQTLSNTASQYVITSGSNDKIVFNDGTSDYTATLAAGTYTADGLAAEIKSKMEAATGAADTYTVTYSSATGKFTINNNNTGGNPATLTLKWLDANSTAAGILGFDTVDSSVAKGSSDTSDFVGGMFIDNAGVANSTNGRVKLVFGTTGTLAVDDKFSIDVFNPEMQAAQDAVIKVDNTTITKSSNTITDAIQGVTMNLLKADTSSTVTLTVSSDTSGAKTAVKSFVDSYNTVIKFINDQLSYDPKLKKANPLLGDPTLVEIRRKLGDIVSGRIPGLSSSSYTNLSQIGITSDKTTGKLTMDDSKVSAALNSNPDAVAKLFIGTATATNQAITFVSKTSKTQAGTYSISISTAPEQAILKGDNDLSSTGLGSDETLTFKYSKDKTAASPTETTFSVTLKAGSTINTIVNTLNSTFATQKVGLSASNDSGKLKITSTDYGADIWFQVTTNQGGANQIWSSSGTRSDAGVDIAGSINNHVATGKGNVLTAMAGFPEEGLKISTTSNQTGGMGSIAVSLGVADRLPSTLGSYTNTSSGVLKSKESSIQESVDYIKSRIERMEERLVNKEKLLREQFVRLENLLAKLNVQSQYVTNQLSKIPTIGYTK